MSSLPIDLISQFVKITKDTDSTKKEITAYGTIVRDATGNKCVQLDGSQLYTPISSTVDAIAGDRVTVLLKNHTAIVTGNITSPSVHKETVQNISSKVDSLDAVSMDYIEAANARIGALEGDTAVIKGNLSSHTASIGAIETDNIKIKERLTAVEADVGALEVDSLDARYARLENLDATNAIVADLKANALTATSIEGKFANIDFSNITDATIASFYAKSGLIKNATVSNATITGELVGVTISGDLIKAGTLVADKLVIQGTDGLYYKLNTDGIKTEASQTDYNSLNGSIIAAKSITATKIDVDDLVAFDATIGGFNITDDSLYSGVKSTVSNTTRGIYLDTNGQIVFGDASNYVKYYLATDGTYKLDISAGSIKFGTNNTNLETAIDEATKNNLRMTAINLSSDEYDEDMYYPVVGSAIPFTGYKIFQVNVQLTSGTKPSWSTHNNGFTCNLTARMKANGWGTTTYNMGWIDDFSYKYCDKMPAYINQMVNSSLPVLYLRGGGHYYVYTDYECTWSVKTSEFVSSEQSVAPTTEPSNYISLVNNWNNHNDLVAAKADITVLNNKITSNVTETTALGSRMSTVEQTATDLTVKLSEVSGRVGDGGNLLINGAPKSADNWTLNGRASYVDGYFSVDTYTPETANGHADTISQSLAGRLPTVNTALRMKVSFDIRDTSDDPYGYIRVWLRLKDSSGGYTWPDIQVMLNTTTSDWTHYSGYIDIPANHSLDGFGVGLYTTSSFDIRGIFVEEVTDIVSASKTATDYLNLSSAGLVVGQNPSSPTAGNTLISTDGVTIRKGTTILAEFKAASRTASGISSATLTSTDSTDSESDGTTKVSGTITSGGTRANVYISTNGNPVYLPNGLETDKVLINNSSGIISNSNIILNASLVDKSGEGILTPLNSYGNTVIGYGRYEDGGNTHVYGTCVKTKTKSGFSASVNGVSALDTNNSAGNATFGWHLYNAGKGETNIYGYIASLMSKSDIRLNPEGNHIRFNGTLVPYEDNAYNLGSPSLTVRDIHISGTRDGTAHGISFSNSSGSFNIAGVNADGYYIFGNSDVCTNIVTKSTTTSNTGYSFKITCGENPSLTVNDNDARLLLYGGTDSTSRYIGSMAAYKRTYSNAANMYVTNNGMIGRSTSSSERYKKDIVNLPLDVVKGLYELPVRQFKYRTECISADDERYERDIPGFIAEEVKECLPIACDHIKDQNGELVPEMWNSKIIIPALLKLIQDLNSRVKDLEERSA